MNWKDELKQKNNLIEKLKQEAKIHAQEARTQHSIVLDIYKYFGIQKGDWNGVNPVMEKHESLLKKHDDALKAILIFAIAVKYGIGGKK